MTKEIGVCGPSDFVLGFNLAGIRRTYATDAKEFPRQIEKLLSGGENLGILIVQGSDLEALPPTLRKKAGESLEPVVIAMGEGAGESDLREKVKRAIGIDLFKK
jgi:V/A-type H+/Na+-transporting ATPase subunit F